MKPVNPESPVQCTFRTQGVLDALEYLSERPQLLGELSTLQFSDNRFKDFYKNMLNDMGYDPYQIEAYLKRFS